ncbi:MULTISPECIES: TIGR04222 domain-containing membrane protein [Nostocaceae]|uniref:TIGR04222 domain-containing membrane protein n=1 Tax=Nostocaceae TaxID=1162 RepID=UPI00168815D0|nr:MULTISPECIES: TIGR04222 domain-containing membrane protein [Nostocaceae]MBD2474376.1 TIGR04222 domain-containing membrane protein [Anabaena sp. FACHB-83]
MDKLLLTIISMLLIVTIRSPLNNPIANMYGPHFLVFYAGIISVTLLASYYNLKFDATAQLPLPSIPTNPDPYKIAYLRGGESEVISLVILNLLQDGYLQINQDTIEQSTTYSYPDNLSLIERQVFDYFVFPKLASQTLSYTISNTIIHKYWCETYEESLLNEQLLLPKTARDLAKKISVLGSCIILGLGGYKLSIALLKGYNNVFFLIIIGLIYWIIFILLSCPSRRTQLGERYIKQLQQSFIQLKNKIIRTISDDRNDTDLNMLLPVAIFGVGILHGTSYTDFAKIFAPLFTSHDTGGSDGGGGCGGGGGGGGGGGCGGCGGCGGG